MGSSKGRSTDNNLLPAREFYQDSITLPPVPDSVCPCLSRKAAPLKVVWVFEWEQARARERARNQIQNRHTARQWRTGFPARHTTLEESWWLTRRRWLVGWPHQLRFETEPNQGVLCWFAAERSVSQPPLRRLICATCWQNRRFVVVAVRKLGEVAWSQVCGAVGCWEGWKQAKWRGYVAPCYCLFLLLACVEVDAFGCTHNSMLE